MARQEVQLTNVCIIFEDKRRFMYYSTWQSALESLRWWVVLDETEREFAKFVFGK